MTDTTKKSTARQAADALDKLERLAAKRSDAIEAAVARTTENYAAKARALYDSLPVEVQRAVDQLRNVGVDIDDKAETEG